MDINATLIGQIVTFAIFVALTVKFVWPKLSQALEERRKKIADGLAAADRGQHELDVAQHKAKEVLQEAKAQAAMIVEQATLRAHHIEEESKEAARVAAARIKKAAEDDVAQQYQHAKTQLQTEIADLVVLSTEKVLGQKLDQANDEALIKKAITEVQAV